jgi:hypothetical protein
MVPVRGVIVRSEVDEHVIIIDWDFSDERYLLNTFDAYTV